ncbi:MAG TPA: PilZ domain-containing protein [Terracidiphilus sp.]|nr:PilZ domain-containing protein [Terracidiphilus sp.]
MNLNQKPASEVLSPRRPKKPRKHPRMLADGEAVLHLVHPGCSMPCSLLNVSLGGCRVRTRDLFVAGIMIRVEVDFKICGVPFRLPGVTQWTDRRNLVGIRFLEMAARHARELAEALGELQPEPLPEPFLDAAPVGPAANPTSGTA